MKNNHNGIRTGFLFLAGGLVGAGIALLYAPQSGQRTRKELRRMGHRAVERTQDLQESVTNQLDRLADDLRRVTNRGIKGGKQVGRTVTRGFVTSKRFMSETMGRAADLLRQ